MDAVIRPERAVADQSFDRGSRRHRTRADDQLVIRNDLVLPGLMCHVQLEIGGVDLGGQRVQSNVHAGRVKIVERPMSEIPPVLYVTGDVVRNPADGKVRVRVGHDDRDLGRRVEFASPQGRADARVTAANGYQVHKSSFRHAVCRSLSNQLIRSPVRSSDARVRRITSPPVGGSRHESRGLSRDLGPRDRRTPTPETACRDRPDRHRHSPWRR